MKTIAQTISLTICLLTSCCNVNQQSEGKVAVIFDTDTNNELDDQHALAYLLLSGEDFNVEGITVNSTTNGGPIEEHLQEAHRILQLCELEGKVPLLKGADGNFDEIEPNMIKDDFDGWEAVHFIIQKAKSSVGEKLIIIAVGKLTNVALALKKAPEISNDLRIVWLGSNYPDPGEYNLINDIPSVNFVLNSGVEFEMVTVRYGEASGTDAVRVTKEAALRKMPGLGPHILTPVTGRHGDKFLNFGDYSVNLFEHIDYHGTPPSRALFDMAAVAIVKNPDWAEQKSIPAPIMIDNQWVQQPNNPHKIVVWENFDKENILQDFYHSLDDYIPVK